MAGRTYRYFRGEPVYGFGYGLSYTTFAYGAVTVRRGADAGIIVETDVTNTGTRGGDEVAQLYLTFPDAPGTPRIALRGFQRLSLAKGETGHLRFALSPRDTSSVSPEGVIRVLAGRYTAYVGGSQPGAGLPGNAATFAVEKPIGLPN